VELLIWPRRTADGVLLNCATTLYSASPHHLTTTTSPRAHARAHSRGGGGVGLRAEWQRTTRRGDNTAHPSLWPGDGYVGPAELFIWERLLASDHRTLDPNKADFFFVPTCAPLAPFRFVSLAQARIQRRSASTFVLCVCLGSQSRACV